MGTSKRKQVKKYPLQRLILIATAVFVFVVFILYISLIRSNESKKLHKNTYKDKENYDFNRVEESQIEQTDYDMFIDSDEMSPFNKILKDQKQEWEESLYNIYQESSSAEASATESSPVKKKPPKPRRNNKEPFVDEPHSPFIDSDENFEELSSSEMDEVEQRMNERRAYVKEACKDFKIDEGGQVNAHEFLINEKYHLIWCNIFKAASTSWMYNFNLMAGFNKEEASNSPQPQALARERYPRPSVDELMSANKNSTSMIIIRHPFERLSSAYRDKMQNCPPMSMYANLAEKIVMEYRIRENSNSDESILYPQWPTFEEFVRYVLDEDKKGNVLDVHWAPFVPFCTPCHFDFDVIAKFETLEEDQKYLIQKAGLRHVITPQWRNYGGTKSVQRGRSSTELVNLHYQQLKSSQISQLYKLYRYDFILFNYTVGEYFPMARGSGEVMPYFHDYSSSEENTSY